MNRKRKHLLKVWFFSAIFMIAFSFGLSLLSYGCVTKSCASHAVTVTATPSTAQTIQETDMSQKVPFDKIMNTMKPSKDIIVTLKAKAKDKTSSVGSSEQVTDKNENEVVEVEAFEPLEYNYYSIVDHGMTYSMPIEHQDYLWKMCSEYGIKEHYELMLALCYHESRYNPSTISRTHDYGYMQINSCNHSWLRKTLGVHNFLDPYENIRSGVYMYSRLINKYHNEERALVAYNAGESYAKNHGSTKYSRAVIYDENLLTLLN